MPREKEWNIYYIFRIKECGVEPGRWRVSTGKRFGGLFGKGDGVQGLPGRLIFFSPW
jgi:hypothetical protein